MLCLTIACSDASQNVLDASASTWVAGTTEFKGGGRLRALMPILPFPCNIHSFIEIFWPLLFVRYVSVLFSRLLQQSCRPSVSLTPESVGNSPLSQKVLSFKIEDQQFSNLFHSATLTDRAHLLSISSPYASAWVSVTPSLDSTSTWSPQNFKWH